MAVLRLLVQDISVQWREARVDRYCEQLDKASRHACCNAIGVRFDMGACAAETFGQPVRALAFGEARSSANSLPVEYDDPPAEDGAEEEEEPAGADT